MSRQPTPDVFGAVLGPVDVELSPLTTWEGGRLTHLEQVIEAGLQTFYDVGGALMEIRDGRLYRQTHRSFEAYTKERWGMGKSRAHQLMEAASTVAAISGPVTEGDPSTIVDVLPTNEAQVRPLAGLDDQAKREVWAEAVATAPAGKVTGRHVAAVAEKGRGARGEGRLFADDLAPLVNGWIEEHWPGALPENPSHTNGTFWQQITAWMHKRVEDAWYESDLKFAIKQVAAVKRREMGLDRAPAVVDIQPSPKPSTIVDTLPGRDGRIERAQRLIDQCRAIAGRAFEDEYTALVGTPSDLLAVGRALDGIVAKLEHLQGTLQGEQEVESWGEF